MVSQREWISEVEFEARYGIKRRTLQGLRTRRTGPPYRKFGKSVRYNLREADAWANTRPRGGDRIEA